MNIFVLLLLPLAAVALLAAPLLPAYRRITRGSAAPKTARRSILANLCVFAGICLVAIILPLNVSADTAAAASAQGMGYLAAAIVTGVACLGAGIAVAAGAPAAIGAVSEDPKSFGKAMIFVVLGEGIAIYGLLISILILNSL